MGLIRPIPSFAQGYATHQACIAPWAWKRVVAAYAPFLGIQGNKLYDFSGKGNHGDINGATWALGKDGPVLNLNGSSHYIDLGTNSSLNLTQNFSVSFQVKPDLAQKDGLIYGRDKSGNDFVQLQIRQDNVVANRLKIQTHNGSFRTVNVDNFFAADTWVDGDVVFGVSGVVTVYKNGVPFASGTLTGGIDSDAGARAYIGTMQFASFTNFFAGLIDEVIVYNRPRPAAEIAWLNSNPFVMFQRAISPAMFFVPEVVPAFLVMKLALVGKRAEIDFSGKRANVGFTGKRANVTFAKVDC